MPITVHMIAQAHLDPVWLWRWTEGRAEALATSQSALDRLNEYPDLQFTRGEAKVYQWIEEENPAMFQEIAEVVRQGRWHLVNGMVIQPDVNLPQGESLVRQALLGKAYFERKFGQEVRIAYCVDSFGHPGTLPQILKLCGFDHYVFMRPQEHEKTLPPQAFWWQSPDGTRLLTFRISRSYASWDDDLTPWIEAALVDRPEALAHTACFFGVGNHGGGPTKRQIEGVIALNQQREDIELRFSSLQAYFEAVNPNADQLPVVEDELQYHAVGCYSVNSQLKRLHRQAECALLQAERMAAIAEILTGHSADRDYLASLWLDLCFNQFHDILAGTCIKTAQDESEMSLARVLLSAREIIDQSARLVGERVNTSGRGGTVILFNPFPYPTTQYIEYEPWTGQQRWAKNGWGLVDDEGSPVPWQVIEPQPATGSSPERGYDRLVFQANLPALGYRTYRFDKGLPAAVTKKGVWASPGELENEHLILKLDLESGTIISCLDKQTGSELVGEKGWNAPQVMEDPSDTWSHGVRTFDQVLGHFGGPDLRTRVEVAEDGPLQASLFIERTWQDDTGARGSWLQQLVLRSGEKELTLRNWLNWQGAWRTIKLAFDTAVDEPQGIRDVPYGGLPFPNDGLETPMQMWAMVSGKTASGNSGLAVLNDGKYGCDLTGSNLRLTVLRCPPYGYHVPHVIGTKQRYDWIDQGMQTFSLVLCPFSGAWQEAGIVRRSRELNLPVVPVTMHAHPGSLPASRELCSLDTSELELTALKPVEAGSGIVVRFADRHGRGGAGTFTWMGQEFHVACKPYEVRAYRVEPDGTGWRLQPCDFLERNI